MTSIPSNKPERTALSNNNVGNKCQIQDIVFTVVEAKGVVMEIIVEMDVIAAIVVVVANQHPMLDGVMVYNLILIATVITNFFVLVVGDTNIPGKIVGT